MTESFAMSPHYQSRPAPYFVTETDVLVCHMPYGGCGNWHGQVGHATITEVGEGIAHVYCPACSHLFPNIFLGHKVLHRTIHGMPNSVHPQLFCPHEGCGWKGESLGAFRQEGNARFYQCPKCDRRMNKGARVEAPVKCLSCNWYGELREAMDAGGGVNPACKLCRSRVRQILAMPAAEEPVVMDVDGKIRDAIDIAVRYGGHDGDHHKAWVIDQMVRILAGPNYARVVAEARSGDEGPNTYEWDEGIAP